jgi:hypothetical protein
MRIRVNKSDEYFQPTNKRPGPFWERSMLIRLQAPQQIRIEEEDPVDT